MAGATDADTTTPQAITSASNQAFAVGLNGATNPAFNIDSSTALQADGVNVKGLAAGNGAALSVITSGTNSPLTIDAAGSGTITLGGTSTGNVLSTRAVAGSSSIKSSSPTAGIGYATGAGSTVTQASSRTTGVTINAVTGSITLVSAAGSATAFTFTVTNSAVAATDCIVINQKSGTDLYVWNITAVGAGSFNLTLYTTGGTTTEQPVFNFVVIKGVTS